MKPSRPRIFAAIATTLCLIHSASGQTVHPAPEVVQAQLSDALSMIGGDLMEPRTYPPQVTRDGNAYRISVPLPGLTAPPKAAIDAIATPLATGVWDVTSLTLPSSGAMPMTRADATSPGTLSFSIGQQAIHARIDPGLLVASPFAAELGDIAVHIENGSQRTQQTIERYTLQGTLIGDGAGQVNLQTQASAANWHINATEAAAVTANSLIRSAAGSFNVEGLDRVQAQRLAVAARTVATDLQAARAEADLRQTHGTSAPVTAPPLSPAGRAHLRAMVDACTHLLTRLEAEDTLQDIRFEAAHGNSGSMSQLHFGLASEARNNRLNAQLDVTLNDLALSAVPADLAAYLPRRIEIKPVLSSVHIDQVMRLLRDATAAEPDQPAVRAEAIALLNEPGAHIGIDSLFLQSGPLRIEGSARLRPQPDGNPGADIHLMATGLDALITEGQSNQRVQQILPMVFLAKGMARSEGDRLVWDISLRDGAVTVNGTPMGQVPGGRSPSAR